ncbi:hypothetical protein RhiirC2_787347 [Rhizophagus irregularis]|uniref:Uncharacterized protein n=1 Tax=Rhizophagus irregularis TaxID=588596 RepID=A0A2N1MSC5_9GLOM|nr:hypothetical protein RhiirC2_787347 [Rhizophagus irregularis]
MSKEQMHHQLSQQIGKIKLKIKTKKIDWQKIDGIIHHLTYNMELGALEAARSFVNDGDKKLPIESFKMPKTLKDILVNMIRSKHDIHSTSDHFSKTILLDFLKFLKAISLVFIEQKTPNLRKEDLISEILGNDQDLSRPLTPQISIVDCFETPHKKKNKPNKKTPGLISFFEIMNIMYSLNINLNKISP